MTESATNMSPEWVAQVLKANPCVLLESGNIRSCPVRLSFPYLFKPQEAMEPGKDPKYAVTLLFPSLADLSVLKAEAGRTAREKWPNAGQPGGPTLHSPFRDQTEKTKFEGYEAGAIFITATANRKPPVVDTRLVPVVDTSKAYPGVWGLVTLRPFAFENKLKKGVSFGLQSVMIFADDKELGGGGSDPNKDFAGVAGAVDVSNEVDPASLF